MKGHGKLRVIRTDAPPDDEAEATPEERRAAEELRGALELGTDSLTRALGAAYGAGVAGEIEEADLDAILHRALGDEARTTTLERAAGERLRVELSRFESPSDSDETRLARALRAAHRPTDVDAATNASLIRRALTLPLRLAPLAVRRIGPRTAAAVMTVTALAAGVLLFLGKPSAPSRSASIAPAPFAAPAALERSADDLFDPAIPFPPSGDESARIDRIAAARASDLRANRFAAWGVR